jgi:hypothetical protein
MHSAEPARKPKAAKAAAEETFTIPSSVLTITEQTFCNPSDASVIEFERGSRITVLPTGTFAYFRSVKSICMPASVEVIESECFTGGPYFDAWPLSTVTFESGSKLRVIQKFAFKTCRKLKSIRLPASVQVLTGSSFAFSGFTKLMIDRKNPWFHVNGDFVMDVGGSQHHPLFRAGPDSAHSGWD